MGHEFQSVDEFHSYVRDKAVEDEEFRGRRLADPKAVMEEELDLSIPEGFNIEVHEETASTVHLVIPPSARLAERDLQAVAGGGLDWDWCSPI